MRNALALAVLAGGMMPLMAHAQSHRKIEVLEVAIEVQPIRVAKARLIDGRAVKVGDWIPYRAPGQQSDLPDTVYFDLYEADPLGVPTNFCDSGCTQMAFCPAAGPSSRWFFGVTTYINPFHTNDMTILPAATGAQSTRTLLAWSWGPTVPTQCIVAVFTAETFNDCTIGPPGTAGDFDGVIYDYGPQARTVGYFIADNDLSLSPGLFHQMPVDGTGAYSIVLANFVDPITQELTLELTPGTQPMLWGTGDHETPPDGRVGTHGEFHWDDDAPADGVHTVLECYSGAVTGDLCPSIWAGMIMFMGEPVGTTCYANCDGSTEPPVLNVADFGCFLQKYAANDPYANCDESTDPPVLNVADFGCFLQKYAAGCP